MSIEAAIAALKQGEIVGVPTDTLYGLAADPFRQDALEMVFTLKGRPTVKPMAILVASIEAAMQIGELSDRALELADDYWPGPLTLVIPRLATTPEWLGHPGRRTIGIRCPDHAVALDLLSQSGPLAVTSANITGQSPALNDEEAQALFGDAVSVYLEGEAPGGRASTIIDLTEESPLILREGPV